MTVEMLLSGRYFDVLDGHAVFVGVGLVDNGEGDVHRHSAQGIDHSDKTLQGDHGVVVDGDSQDLLETCLDCVDTRIL